MSGFAVSAAYYAAAVSDFQADTTESIVGALTMRGGSVDATQRDAWVGQIGALKTALGASEGAVFLEFDVPRIGSRIDAVLVAGPAVVVIEFKVGERDFRTADRNQVWDYALDLKNFHEASHAAPIVPILVATEAADVLPLLLDPADDGVFPPVMCNASRLGEAIQLALSHTSGAWLDPLLWSRAPYHPTPTIIEAAQALYSRHSVDAIARHDAGAQNLQVTSTRVEAIIEDARRRSRKVIVFVTGVPGAGKTLVGLNIATHKRGDAPTHAVFLSGNGPLVRVLSEALARDEVARRRRRKDMTRKGVIQQAIKAFIQNVHHFRDAGLRDTGPPLDRVVIFDEAQRAWNRDMTSDFMRRKKGRLGFSQSEPEFLLSYLNRHQEWAVVICLVGGGQEINRGEAGISAWLDAVATRYTNWTAYISPNLTDSEYDAGHALQTLGTRAEVVTDESLHLSVSMRSFRAEHVSRFVKAVLDGEAAEASALLTQFSPRYPVVLSRDLARAKAWIHSRARGSERFGLVASSSAERLKPHAVDVRVKVDPVHWFLNDRDDTRSSFYLEDAATEFQVQGLELDWVCVTWDADLRFAAHDWTYHSFVASKWQNVKAADRRHYLLNAYRVLLTRARQGMVIFVPPGDSTDPTRRPDFYDPTFQYLQAIGLPTL
jgi:Schlafen group 3, DNA/RNA helicase domain